MDRGLALNRLRSVVGRYFQMTKLLNTGSTFWIANLLYAAAILITFNFRLAGFVFVALSVLWVLLLSASFVRQNQEINRFYWLGNICSSLFVTPALVMMSVRNLDNYPVIENTLAVVCISGLLGAMGCAGFTKISN